jgi:hypothetical protein
MNMHQSRRRYMRAAVTLASQGDTKTEPTVERSFSALTRDVAARGVCLILKQPIAIPIGQEVFLRLEFILGEVPIKAHGIVRWTDHDSKCSSHQIIGVELMGMRSVRNYERWLEMLSYYEKDPSACLSINQLMDQYIGQSSA